MATFQIAGSSESDVNSSTTPLVVLFERDDTIAVPLLSQLRMAGYDVRSSRTPVELFDILGKHLVSLVLVDLGSATAGRREFWVALDAQRRGRAIQVMTFRYSPPGGLYDMDFEQTARAIADVEVRGAHEFQLVIDAVRQRIPLHGGVNPLASPGGLGMAGGFPGGFAPIGAALGVPSPFSMQGVAGFGMPQISSGVPNSPSLPQFMPQDPSMGFNPPIGHMYGALDQQGYAGPPIPPGFGMPPAEMHVGYAQGPFRVPQGQAAMPGVPGYDEAASPFAHPIAANPFSSDVAASPFAQPYDMNPFAVEPASPSSGLGMSDAPVTRMASPFAPESSPFFPASSPPPFVAAYVAPEPQGAGQRFDVADFERRAAQLSAAYAAQFDIASPAPGQVPSQSGFDFGGTTDGLGWGAPHDAPGRSYPGFAGSFGSGVRQNAYGAPRTPEPISDVWTPPDADDSDLEGATGVVPEMASKPISPATDSQGAAWQAPSRWPQTGDDNAEMPFGRASAVPGESDSEATMHMATAPLPTPPSMPAVYRGSQTEKALSAVLVEGALLDESKLETLKGIQQMLASVDMNVKLGELALLFKFLSPDQLLAALLVSRGLVSPAQIAGLGRVKQDLAASGMDYDLETLLSMFTILPEDQLQMLRNELASARKASA